MKMKSIVLGALATLSAMTAAQAQVGVTGSLGSTGACLHLSVQVAQQLNARFGVNGLSYSHDGSTSESITTSS